MTLTVDRCCTHEQDDWIPNLQRLCVEGGNHSGSDPSGHQSMSCTVSTGISNLRCGAGAMMTAAKTANDFVVPCAPPFDATPLAMVALLQTEGVVHLRRYQPTVNLLVSCHDTAAIWVAFFSRCQRYRGGQG